jgi:transcriptional regulator with XRE-family HTH domain
MSMKEFRPAKKRIEVTVGESVRILRELQELSQTQLSELTGIPQATISAIENGRVNLGVERAKVLARALKCAQVSPGSARIPRVGCAGICGITRRSIRTPFGAV